MTRQTSLVARKKQQAVTEALHSRLLAYFATQRYFRPSRSAFVAGERVLIPRLRTGLKVVASESVYHQLQEKEPCATQWSSSSQA